MVGTSILEISESALKHNLSFLRKVIGPEVRFSSVVKGYAYGHGFAAFIPLAEKCGIDHFSVFSAEEAIKVARARTRDSDVMIVGSITEDEMVWAIENGISFYVFDRARLETAMQTAQKLKLPARIHLELETGMNRLGFEENDLEAVAAKLKEAKHDIMLEGVCTHYAGAESIGNYVRIQQQIERFKAMCETLERAGVTIPCRHTASSAATLTYPETHMEMVRVGIAQYGYWPSQETRMHY
ncbi:alanine racemase, partial [bacterium]|nr:alanine racemase [bacterium]